jgi:hypothetical protein
MDHYVEKETLIQEEKDFVEFFQPVYEHLSNNNEYIKIVDACPFGSIGMQIQNGNFNFDNLEVSRIMHRLVLLGKAFRGRQYILTNLNPAQICLNKDNIPKLIGLNGIREVGKYQSIDSLPEYLPPEYYESYLADSKINFSDKFMSYGFGLLFYLMIKHRPAYSLDYQNQENIWDKEIHFEEIDRQNFVNFILKTLVNHHLRIEFHEVVAAFYTETGDGYFDFGLSRISQDKFYTIEDNIIHRKEVKILKSSLIKIFIFLIVFLGILFLGTFFFCRDTFFVFMPKNEQEETLSLENSGEYSISVKEHELATDKNDDDHPK